MTVRRALWSITAALALTGCGSPDAAAPVEGGPLTVVASTNVYGSIAEAVGGADVAVESLIADPAADPHSYESTPADAVTVAAAAVVIVNGGGYDEFVPRLLESVGGDHAVIDVAELSELVPAGDAESNEHLWYCLPTVQRLATRIADELSAADAEHADEYAANAAEFGAEIAALTERAEAIGASVPGARVALTEPVPGYLIETAGLTDATPPEFAEAVEQDTDPPAAVLQETLALFTPGSPDPIRALILNSQTQGHTTDQVRSAAGAAGVPVVEMTETLPAGRPDYLTWMSAQIDALAAALNPV